MGDAAPGQRARARRAAVDTEAARAVDVCAAGARRRRSHGALSSSAPPRLPLAKTRSLGALHSPPVCAGSPADAGGGGGRDSVQCTDSEPAGRPEPKASIFDTVRQRLLDAELVWPPPRGVSDDDAAAAVNTALLQNAQRDLIIENTFLALQGKYGVRYSRGSSSPAPSEGDSGDDDDDSDESLSSGSDEADGDFRSIFLRPLSSLFRRIYTGPSSAMGNLQASEGKKGGTGGKSPAKNKKDKGLTGGRKSPGQAKSAKAAAAAAAAAATARPQQQRRQTADSAAAPPTDGSAVAVTCSERVEDAGSRTRQAVAGASDEKSDAAAVAQTPVAAGPGETAPSPPAATTTVTTTTTTYLVTDSWRHVKKLAITTPGAAVGFAETYSAQVGHPLLYRGKPPPKGGISY
ncbi:uncharacterized protein LOC124620180 [Schistocerca americana]|uniref:uncharacterized protein LOC124620180 n=1 Tax=Schistocerca americana TaxID=7009 RepID=UPI001F4FDBD0|nr:uncharacterized protein LOC124620180 [Schistocerca americana]